jgi:hypothetical protein
MYELRAKQITRLEKRARPFIEQRLGSAERWERVRRGALNQAVALGFLLRYGEPQIGEPLEEACQRVTKSDGWKEYQGIIPPRMTLIGYEDQFGPWGRGSVVEIGEVLRHLFVSRLPGRSEKEKINAILQSAPPWIIWFTFADYTAAVLDLEIPDLSSVRRFARFRTVFDIWWALPSGAFERLPWSEIEGCEIELADLDLGLLRPEPGRDRLLTKRERKRQIAASFHWPDEWPAMYPLDWLRLARTDSSAAMAKAGAPGFVPEKRHPKFCGEMRPDLRYRRHGDTEFNPAKLWPLAKDVVG